jgi:aspartyl protease family protein
MNRLFWIVMAVMGGGLILLVANHDSGSVFGIGNDAFARLLYLGVLGVVIAAAMVASRGRFGDMARNLAIWALVAVVLMGGYQYRYELQDVASRLTAGFIPGSPISVRDDDGRTAVMLERVSSGHFERRVCTR